MKGNTINHPEYEKSVRWIDGHRTYNKLAFNKYQFKKICSVCHNDDVKLLIHHKNGNRRDNNKSNLSVMCYACHSRHHGVGQILSKFMTKLLKGKTYEQAYGVKKAALIKLKQHAKRIGRKHSEATKLKMSKNSRWNKK